MDQVCQVGNKSGTQRWIFWIHLHLPSVPVKFLYNSQEPSSSPKGSAATVFFLIHVQVIAFERILRVCKPTAYVQTTLITDVCRSESQPSTSKLFCWLLQNDADLQLPRIWLAAFAVIFHAGFCWCNRKLFHLLFFQVTDTNKSGLQWSKINMRHNTEAQMLSITTSLFPAVAKCWMAL